MLLFVPAARHNESSFVASVMLSGEREREAKTIRKPGITHKFHAGDSTVFPEVPQQGILAVIQAHLSMCVFECLCVKGWMRVSFDLVKDFNKKWHFCF